MNKSPCIFLASFWVTKFLPSLMIEAAFSSVAYADYHLWQVVSTIALARSTSA